MIYTARYRYCGPDRLDITVKGQHPIGRLFAPTWDMVLGVKKGTMSQGKYRSEYFKKISNLWWSNQRELMDFVQKVKNEDVTVVCFCKVGAFCHRYLLTDWLHWNWGINYGGER